MVYKDSIPPNLKPAAAKNVELHMGKLLKESLVEPGQLPGTFKATHTPNL